MLRGFALDVPEGHFANPPALTKPFLWIEYAHAMGNGAGSLKEYMELHRAVPGAARRLHLGVDRSRPGDHRRRGQPDLRLRRRLRRAPARRQLRGRRAACCRTAPPPPRCWTPSTTTPPSASRSPPAACGSPTATPSPTSPHLRAEVSAGRPGHLAGARAAGISLRARALEVALPVHDGATTTVRLTTREAQGPVPAGSPDRLRGSRGCRAPARRGSPRRPRAHRVDPAAGRGRLLEPRPGSLR